MREPNELTDILMQPSDDKSFDNVSDFSGNSGYVEAIYTSAGVIVLRSTDDKEKDISTEDLLKLMK